MHFFTLFTTFTATLAAATPLQSRSGCDQGVCPEHGEDFDLVEHFHGDDRHFQLRFKDDYSCYALDNDGSGCADITYNGRPVSMCIDARRNWAHWTYKDTSVKLCFDTNFEPRLSCGFNFWGVDLNRPVTCIW